MGDPRSYKRILTYKAYCEYTKYNQKILDNFFYDSPQHLYKYLVKLDIN